jgi:mono/diheme cytochrome c family protein
MKNFFRNTAAASALGCLLLCLAGCRAPGAPGPAEERPDEIKNFAVLYKQNCAACHGEQGRGGIAVSLANPVYISIAGKDAIAKATREGGPGALMPAFGRKYGGFLTDEQVGILADGIVRQWGRGVKLDAPSYAATLKGDPAAGKAVFDSYCARCHGPEASPQKTGQRNAGSIVDADFLALISDQNLRSTILAGKPDEGMPDWRTLGPQPLTDRQITDIVAWLSAQRRPATAHPPTQQNATQGVKP